MINVQDRGQLFHIFRRSLRLSVEDGCYCDLIAAELLRYIFEGEILGCFGFKEGVGLHGEAIAEGALESLSVWLIRRCARVGLASRVEILVVAILAMVMGCTRKVWWREVLDKTLGTCLVKMDAIVK